MREKSEEKGIEAQRVKPLTQTGAIDALLREEERRENVAPVPECCNFFFWFAKQKQNKKNFKLMQLFREIIVKGKAETRRAYLMKGGPFCERELLLVKILHIIMISFWGFDVELKYCKWLLKGEIAVCVYRKHFYVYSPSCCSYRG